jgi:hypothetical protein
MTGIHVHDDVGFVQGLERIGNTLTVASCRGLAVGNVRVGDKVGERIRLNDKSEGRVGVGINERGKSWRPDEY